MQLENKSIVGKVLTGIATFKNPLPIALSNGKFTVQGPGLSEKLNYFLKDDVKVGGIATYQFSMIPQYQETTLVIVNFYAKELTGAYGSATVTITN